MNIHTLIEKVESNYLLGSEAKEAILSLLKERQEEAVSDEDAKENLGKESGYGYGFDGDGGLPIWEDGFDAACAHVRSQISSQITLLEERVELLHEAVMLINYCSSYADFIRENIDIQTKFIETYGNYDMNIANRVSEILSRYNQLQQS